MPTQLNELKRLQDLDLTITGIKEKIDQRPRKLGEQRGVVKKAGEQVETKKKDIMENQKTLDSLEVDLKEGEEKLAKLKILLNAAKTNEEYAVLQRSIKDQERKKSKAEEDILELMGRSDELREELKALQGQVVESEEALRSVQQEVERESGVLRGNLEDHLSKRQELTRLIEGEVLKQYERIFNQRHDGALAEVREKVCQGCFMSAPPQWINRLQIARDIVTCPSCGRILYLSD